MAMVACLSLMASDVVQYDFKDNHDTMNDSKHYDESKTLNKVTIKYGDKKDVHDVSDSVSNKPDV